MILTRSASEGSLFGIPRLRFGLVSPHVVQDGQRNLHQIDKHAVLQVHAEASES